ncbi:LytR family transcriptional regulator [Sporosarcina limicola]|uniref:Polyisoprenyl-teichoic acid--peptidoglycan teichoic acid transferase TagU n=1 Tax=Sporosarcina limicola TaxID=34101 RepID=A0A927MK23_9BACL|nr:LytR family transcriptional regulator [Sporosarcina limicola]MBE1555373.1 LCP family protein required for cell wall assembly [Sporosarcina limicola]
MSRTDRRKKKKWPWIVGIIGVLLLGVFIYGLMIYKGLTDTVKGIHEEIDRDISVKREEAVAFHKKEPFSVLVLGVDEREGDTGRSDTMIVLTVNPDLKTTKMVSIPRDTYTEIVGKGVEDKINHAFAFGGIKMSMESIEHLLDIPIDYVVQVNMESFKDIVNAVGGVTVENAMDFKLDNHSFKKGEVTLNGDDALAYVRMRKEDPRGDFGRQDRQKQVVQGVLREGASVSSLLNYKSIFNAISNHVRTNMTFDEMVEVQKNYRDAAGKIEQLYIKEGEGKRMNGIWYYIMNDEELASVQGELKAHLGLK